MTGLGIPADRITVIRNGVDADLFRPVPREEARSRLGLAPGPLVASVGNLVRGKGHHVVLRALARIPGARGLIVGRGPEERRLREEASTLGISSRVDFRGEMPQRALRDVYAAADVLVLASASEGWPNVLLESLACGTPVVATDVGAVREILCDESLGRVVQTQDEAEVAAAISAVLADATDPLVRRAFAERFSWDAVSQAQIGLFEGVLGRAGQRAHDSISPAGVAGTAR